MQFEDIKSLVSENVEGSVAGENLNSTPKTLQIKSDHLVEVCELLHSNSNTYFDSLSCVTGIDNGPEADTMEVIYTLYSIPFDLHFNLSVELPRQKPEINTVSHIWRGADWHERETYDLLGITFQNHPDLRRILLPEDWEGYPLRKDYEEQEIYHEVKVKY